MQGSGGADRPYDLNAGTLTHNAVDIDDVVVLTNREIDCLTREIMKTLHSGSCRIANRDSFSYQVSELKKSQA